MSCTTFKDIYLHYIIMNMRHLQFTNINDEEIHHMLEEDLGVEMYNKEKADIEDWGMGRTSDTCVARLSIIHGKTCIFI